MKPYAIITLKDLKTCLFDNKDDWQTAMDVLNQAGEQFLAMKYHHGATMYQQMEQHRMGQF